MLKLFAKLVIRKRRKKAPNKKPHLAPELWEQIFLYVPRGHLLKLRQTCHYWRNIVDGSSALRDGLHVKFPHDGDQHYAPSRIPPVGWFTFEFVSFSVLPDVGWWWPKVGESVTVLCLGRCEFPLELLRHTPNLKELQLFYVKLVEYDNPGFELRKVEELTVEYVDPDILIVLGQVITNLKLFSFNGSVMAASEEADKERNDMKQLVAMEKEIIRWSPEMSCSLKRLTTNPRLFGEAIFLTDLRVVRNVRIDPTHEELDFIQSLRAISEEELAAFILRYPGLKELILVNCAVENLCPHLNTIKKHVQPNWQPTNDSAFYKLTYWR